MILRRAAELGQVSALADTWGVGWWSSSAEDIDADGLVQLHGAQEAVTVGEAATWSSLRPPHLPFPSTNGGNNNGNSARNDDNNSISGSSTVGHANSSGSGPHGGFDGSGSGSGGGTQPMFWEWRSHRYVHASHGAMGILHALLLCPAELWG
eukprot:TRINITY_DN5989_c0_g1_i1.p2 TRINITY_DN5989_c0_g1~~TRINITY_DN5989_c0_g1_i1.p2  ORF type:complete len:152 (+),score=43.50 TRINITY_DN5989_c0_g1_i1:481-936(+)